MVRVKRKIKDRPILGPSFIKKLVPSLVFE